MTLHYLENAALLPALQQTATATLDYIILISGAFDPANVHTRQAILKESVRALKKGGLLFVQGRPDVLPEMGVYLDCQLVFKYWIAVESEQNKPGHGLPSVHAGIVLFVKGSPFNLQKVRFPHQICKACQKPLRDWGGKTHLMNPEGFAISDVWKNLPRADNYTHLSSPVLETILKLIAAPEEIEALNGLIGPQEGLHTSSSGVADARIQYRLPLFPSPSSPLPVSSPPQTPPSALWNVVLEGDAVEWLKQYPDNSVDLVFADPPYNLDKAYNTYADEHSRQEYLAWCNAWLVEYARILKPTGALYVLNLPHWAMYHAVFLNQRLYFQNWIVWDALSEPRGKLMPAHYSLLFYTKHPTEFTFNYATVGQVDARYYCLRQSCIRHRQREGWHDQEPLTDIWTDIHRIKHRRDRDYHPCQLPDALLERIIRLSTHPGDIVLDALAGTGTTAVVAARLGRRYVAIDIDPAYVQITRDKLAQVTQRGYVQRVSIPKPRPPYNKKALQLELRDLAVRLGRLPTPEDIQEHSPYSVETYLEAFPTWGKALKAAKLVDNGDNE
ncbi:MAG TPA: DNA methyltransferase [Anaerolineae bacterium]|mgnify:CR=1 FL=1|nr:DNA methyltransferase [Anaerolineae bacterium]HQH37441.1 DNA methyltransferase [Anaerolineae bacterium]